LSPGRVVSETRALSPVAAGLEARLIRAFGLANTTTACTHLGYFEEALEMFDESRRLFAEAGVSASSTHHIEKVSLATSAVCLGADLRGRRERTTSASRGAT
jgi:hypothetical protein